MRENLRYQLSLSLIAFVFLMPWLISCAGEIMIEDPSAMGGSSGESSGDQCPDEYLRDDGSCWLSDPSAYNEIVDSTGESPNLEDLLNVDDSIIEEQTQWFLAQEGAGKYYVYVDSERDIGVRVLNNVGVPVPGIRISFEILMEQASDPRGSQISAFMAETDQYGVALVVVTGGSIPTFF